MYYDYEFIFTGKIYNQTIYDNCTITCTDNTARQNLIETITNQLHDLLIVQHGINHFSTFASFEGKTYKITLM
jgi:hypothetical protein